MPSSALRSSSLTVVAATAACILAGCRELGLVSSKGSLELLPKRVEFDAVHPEQSAERAAVLINSGRATLRLAWALPDEPFELSTTPDSAPPGELSLTLRFKPSGPGAFASLVRLQAEDGLELLLELSGSALELPACYTSGPCRSARFDAAIGECVEEELADGTPCDFGSACVLAAGCQAGRCVGTERSCDDGDACTVDACNAESGCEHFPAPPCPGDGKCQLGVCDSTLGCTLAPASDGTSCGPNRSCEVADVCLSGLCVQRDPPDGFVCAQASPCQGEGRCSGAQCLRPPAVPLTPSWSYDSAAGSSPPELHDFIIEPSGALSLMGFFEVPRLRASGTTPRSAATQARRCILWNNRLVCADYPYPGSGRVSAIELSTGIAAWTFDLPTARPDFAAAAGPGHLFMARVAALGSDRLAALFEAYPAKAGNPTNCRAYFLITVDPSGKLVSGQQLSDPLLDVCSHPHPFGVASDVSGNLHLAFSPSLPGGAPLTPSSPTLLMSFTRDGVLRWKRTEVFAGGELAVARGSLYPERATVAFSTSNGAPTSFQVQYPLGRAVATSDRVILGLGSGTSFLSGHEPGTGRLLWSYRGTPLDLAQSDQLRLAGWRPRPSEPPTTVAMSFLLRGGSSNLVAVNARDGFEEWACPVAHNFRTAPQLFEVANGSMALMEGSDQCGACDPPFAQSHAAFHRFELSGIEIAREPWVGTFGGGGHDHHEDAPAPPSGPPR
ncbi:MAG: tenascin-X [Myxococcales bacterium]|nr:tenascin-X [Myxococcales bacterium]